MRLAVPDLVSNSYFPAIAAAALGYLRDEGLEMDLELVFPVTDAVAELRAGSLDFLAGAAHAPFHDSSWDSVRLVAALARNTYWFLVVRSDLEVQRSSLAGLSGLRVGAAPGPDLGLRRFLALEGVDPASVRIGPVPRGSGSFGVTAAQALSDGVVDAFWANGMAAEIAVRRGVGRVVVDARRDRSPLSEFTFPALMTSSRMISESPDVVRAVVRAVTRAQDSLRATPSLAASVGDALFPALEAGLIADLVARDVEYYSPEISRAAVASLVGFARETGLAAGDVSYEQIVWAPE